MENLNNDGITISELQQLAIKLLNDPDTVEIIFGGSAGGSKRLRVGTPVLTVDGWKNVEDIAYEDKLIDRFGKPTNILDISWGYSKPTYRITLQDGRTIDADEDHQWQVASQKHFHRDSFRIKTTKQLFEEKTRYSLPYLENPVVGKKWQGPDPYIIGLLLGDGTLTGQNIRVYSIESEIQEYLRNQGWKIYHYDYNGDLAICEATNKQTRNPYRNLLGFNSGDNKFVPQELLLADPETRLRLLQGLMDTDGTIDKDGSAQFITTNDNLRDSVMYLVRSLGGRSSFVKTYKETEKGGRGWYYKVAVGYGEKFNPFSLSRKAKRVVKQQLNMVGIKKIEKIENSDGVCFMVDNPEHLYVAKDFIITHNSMAIGILALLRCMQFPGVREGIGRKDLTQLKKTTLATLLGKVHAIFGVTQQDFKQGQDGSITYRNGSVILPIELAYYPSDPDFNRLGSLELTDMFIDEVGELPEKSYTAIKSRVGRWKNDEYGITPKVFSTCNPSMNFVKQEFFDIYDKLGGGTIQRWQHGFTIYKGEKIPAYKAFVRSSVYDNPFIERSYIETLKRLPQQERRRLLDGNWNYVDDDSSLFKNSLLHKATTFNLPEPTEKFSKFIGVDVADKGKDKSIFSLIDNGVLVAQRESSIKMQWDEAGDDSLPMSRMLADELIDFATKNGFTEHTAKNIAVETNGVGVGLRDFMKHRGWRITEYTATHKSRSEGYYQMMLDMDSGDLRMLHDLKGLDVLKSELLVHTYEMDNQTPSVIKKEKIRSMIGRSPDRADSFMIANYVRNWISNPQNDPRRNVNRLVW